LLPVRNGAGWLHDKLRSIDQFDYPPDRIEIIVVADGCQDATAAIARQAALKSRLMVLELPPSGKWAALNEAMAAASGEILFFTDVRQRIEPEALRRLVSCLADPDVGAASGELFIDAGDGVEERSSGIYWTYEKWIRKSQSQRWTMLGATGAIYAMRRGSVRPLPPYCLNDDVYLPLLTGLAGQRVVLESRARAFDEPTSLGQEFARKVRTQAGVYQLIGYFPKLLLPWTPIFFHFASHKLARLLMPYSLIAVFVSSSLIRHPLARTLFVGQCVFWLLALCDVRISDRNPMKMISSPIRAFGTLQFAALCAISIFVRPAKKFWSEVRKT
jgi:cellulose synthase/poly-beta-1,6-N-acetylglucosamine synthase-like glycosyltransferase